jgi:hypothetical protein
LHYPQHNILKIFKDENFNILTQNTHKMSNIEHVGPKMFLFDIYQKNENHYLEATSQAKSNNDIANKVLHIVRSHAISL